MKGEYKRFDEALYNENDPSKFIALEFLKRKGMEAIINPDKFGVDIIVNDKIGCEVEVKLGWETEVFPFDTLDLSERKQKFAIQYEKNNKPLYFIIFNKLKNRALLVNRKSLKEERLITKKTKFTNNENFFRIPLKEVLLIKVE